MFGAEDGHVVDDDCTKTSKVRRADLDGFDTIHYFQL